MSISRSLGVPPPHPLPVAAGPPEAGQGLLSRLLWGWEGSGLSSGPRPAFPRSRGKWGDEASALSHGSCSKGGAAVGCPGQVPSVPGRGQHLCLLCVYPVPCSRPQSGPWESCPPPWLPGLAAGDVTGVSGLGAPEACAPGCGPGATWPWPWALHREGDLWVPASPLVPTSTLRSQ